MPSDIRNYKLDHIKGVLIILVVFAHFLELFEGSAAKGMYLVIYSFHMPVFVFCSGYFARPDARRMFTRLIYPYVVYQLLYLLFQRMVSHQSNTIQFTRPYWLLWYLMSMIFWTLLLVAVRRLVKSGVWMLAASIAIALAAGYVPFIGYQLSLSRTIVMFPWFLAGYQAGKGTLKLPKCGRAGAAFLTAAVLVFTIWIWNSRGWLDERWLYHSYPYSGAGYDWMIRALFLAAAAVFTAWFMAVMPDRRISWLAYLGQRTMPVFLIHGFVVKGLGCTSVFSGEESASLVLSLLMTVVLCIVLSSHVCSYIASFTYSGDWGVRIFCWWNQRDSTGGR